MLLTLRAALVATFLAMVPGLLDGSETPKAVVVRVAGVGLLDVALSNAPALRRLRLPPLDLAVAAWLVAELVTTVFSRAPWLSVFGELQQHEGLLTSISLAGIYLAARLALRDAGDVQAVLDTPLLGAGGASVYAFLQAAGLGPVPWSPAANFGGAARPLATFGHPNLAGVGGPAAFAIP